jgi:hypothetical protein
MEDIHGLKPLMGMDFPWLSVTVFGLILVFIFSGIGIVLWKLLKRKKPAIKTAPVKITLPKKDPREQALKALKKLKPQPQDPESFYIKLEHILRVYLSEHYQLSITSYTGSELSQFFQNQSYGRNFSAHYLNPLLQVLQHGEQAKFAGQIFTEALQKDDLQTVQQFVENTTLPQQVTA